MSCCKWNRAAEHGEAFWVSQLVNSRFTDWLSTTSRTINHELLNFYFLIPESRDRWITNSGSGSGFFVALKAGTEPYDPGTWNLNLIKPGWWGSKLVHAHSMSHVWKCGVLTMGFRGIQNHQTAPAKVTPPMIAGQRGPYLWSLVANKLLVSPAVREEPAWNGWTCVFFFRIFWTSSLQSFKFQNGPRSTFFADIFFRISKVTAATRFDYPLPTLTWQWSVPNLHMLMILVTSTKNGDFSSKRSVWLPLVYKQKVELWNW